MVDVDKLNTEFSMIILLNVEDEWILSNLTNEKCSTLLL
jgi:hypothetical protein